MTRAKNAIAILKNENEDSQVGHMEGEAIGGTTTGKDRAHLKTTGSGKRKANEAAILDLPDRGKYHALLESYKRFKGTEEAKEPTRKSSRNEMKRAKIAAIVLKEDDEDSIMDDSNVGKREGIAIGGTLTIKDEGAKLLKKLKSNVKISLIWRLWKLCREMDALHPKVNWKPDKTWRQYRVRQAIGLEIERRSGGDESRVEEIIGEMEEERKSYKTIHMFADFLFSEHKKAGRVVLNSS
jgi:hypothetical protein